MRSKLQQHRILAPVPFARGTEVSSLINRITDIRGKINSYLEIGVEYGRTFEAVKARKKVGVDPQFRFHSGFQCLKSRLHEETSDKYFASSDFDVVDIAFLDGLHTAEQTYKDFINLLPRVNEHSVIIIDDTIPSDYHSTLLTPEAAYKSRMNSKILNDYKWHGDVYKCVYAILEAFPKLSYVTVSDMSNPVTVYYGFKSLQDKVVHKAYNFRISNEDFINNKVIKIPKKFNPLPKNKLYEALENYFEGL